MRPPSVWHVCGGSPSTPIPPAREGKSAQPASFAAPNSAVRTAAARASTIIVRWIAAFRPPFRASMSRGRCARDRRDVRTRRPCAGSLRGRRCGQRTTRRPARRTSRRGTGAIGDSEFKVRAARRWFRGPSGQNRCWIPSSTQIRPSRDTRKRAPLPSDRSSAQKALL
jgi:hypothetical protein